MRYPKIKMLKCDLVAWVFENHYVHWSNEYLRTCSPAEFYYHDEDMRDMCIHDMIWDEIYNGDAYEEYVLTKEEALNNENR